MGMTLLFAILTKNFVQKLRYICLPPSCAYPQYKYAWYITSVRGHELSGRVRAHAYNNYRWSGFDCEILSTTRNQ